MLHTGFYRIEPYSTRAILHAYSLSITYLHDLKYGQEIMESALKTHIGNHTTIMATINQVAIIVYIHISFYLEPFISFVTNSCNLFFGNRY